MTDRRGSSPLSGSAGVTLVEVMVVLVILAVGILALSAVQTRSSSDVYATGRSTRALALAQAQLETARANGYDLLAPASGAVDNMTWTTQVDSLSPDMRQVIVTVTWQDEGNTRSLRLDTLMSDR
jgi:prepilin-type N-terminal cleavage/methylation domain-containing protein